MDDNRFDKILRDKIGEYSDDGPGDDALSAFRGKMAASYSPPWYVLYRGELVTAASLLLVGLLLFWAQQASFTSATEEMREEMASIRLQNEELLRIISSQSEASEKQEDSSDANEHLINSLRAQIAALESERMQEEGISPEQVPPTNQSTTALAVNESGPQEFYLGRRDSYPADFISGLSEYFVVNENAGKLYVRFIREEGNADGLDEISRRNILTRQLTQPNFVLMPDTLQNSRIEQVTTVDRPTVRIPVSQQREMEKMRYKGGVGIEIGPAFSMYRAFADPGTNVSSYGAGALVNVIISPHLSLEAGALHNSFEYLVDAQDLSQTSLLPGDEMFGELTGVEVTPTFIDIPVHIKYRYRISAASHLMGGAGLSANLITREEFEYLYKFEAGSGFFIPVEQSVRNKDWQWQLGTANLMLGLSTRLNNDKRLEAMLVYQKSLKPLGTAGVDTDFLGLRTSYYFTVR